MEHEFVSEWFRFADTDLATAEYLLGMRPQPLEIICYHCQQSAEKYLKGYLIFNGIEEPPKTHDLNTLFSMCLKFEPRFNMIDKACAVLARYASMPRYPNEIEIDEGDTQRAIEYARQISDAEPFKTIINRKD